jgi:hypothetical protein
MARVRILLMRDTSQAIVKPEKCAWLISKISLFLLDVKDEIINRKFKYKMSAILCSLEQNNLNMTKHKFVSSEF